MSKRNGEAIATNEPVLAVKDAPEPASPPMDGVEFNSPLLNLAKSILGPFLRHGATCTADACVCGVTAAVQQLRDHEERTRRYGVAGA